MGPAAWPGCPNPTDVYEQVRIKDMNWYQWLSLGALGVCLTSCGYHFVRLVKLGSPVDLAKPSGNISRGVLYSFTTAMSPKHKESAYLHLPTYLAGLVFHLGTFATILLYLISFFIKPAWHSWPAWIAAALLMTGSLCGAGILIKRISNGTLRDLSNPDDYISNILVTLFQLTGAMMFIFPGLTVLFYLTTTFLWLYLPLGKLKHALYFFAARYHLGFFYGRRGVWPVPKQTHAE